MASIPLDKQVAAIEASVNALVTDAVKMVTINATANLVESTPVDTGNARRNWIPAVGARHEAEVDDGGAAQAAGQARVAGYKLDDGRTFVSNPTPYIGRLDAGSSTQAPAGFVRGAVERAVDETQRAVTAAAARRGRGRR
jgi:hypothetical protein